MHITVKKAAIKSGLFLAYEYLQTNADVKNSIKTSSDAPIHDDLRNAFRDMIPHFAMITEEITDEKLVEDAIKSPEDYLEKKDDDQEESPFMKYMVHQVQILGSEGAESIVLVGSKRLATYESVSFSTPSIELDGKYRFASDLQTSIEHFRSEVFEYMQGKQAPKSQQLEMFAGADNEDDGFGE